LARKLNESSPNGTIRFPRAPHGARVSLRLVEVSSESLAVVRGVLQPPALGVDRGAMLTVWLDGEAGYCATADLSANGLQQAAERAVQWARAARGRGLAIAAPASPSDATPGAGPLHYRGPDDEPLASRDGLVELLHAEVSTSVEN